MADLSRSHDHTLNGEEGGSGLWRWVWRLLAAVGMTLLVVTTTARLTLLDAGFDAKAIGATDGYDRVYAQVLPSPAVQRAIRRGLDGLPVDPAYLTANARVLIPPPVLEEVVRRAISEYVDVVLGRAASVDLDEALQPVVDNLVRLVQELAPNAVATAPRLHTGSLAAFNSPRRRPLSSSWLPAKWTSGCRSSGCRRDDVNRVAEVLTAGLPAASRQRDPPADRATPGLR